MITNLEPKFKSSKGKIQTWYDIFLCLDGTLYDDN